MSLLSDAPPDFAAAEELDALRETREALEKELSRAADAANRRELEFNERVSELEKAIDDARREAAAAAASAAPAPDATRPRGGTNGVSQESMRQEAEAKQLRARITSLAAQKQEAVGVLSAAREGFERKKKATEAKVSELNAENMALRAQVLRVDAAIDGAASKAAERITSEYEEQVAARDSRVAELETVRTLSLRRVCCC